MVLFLFTLFFGSKKVHLQPSMWIQADAEFNMRNRSLEMLPLLASRD